MAVICGLKLTHDGAVAVVRDGRLVFSTEAEKLDNRPRHDTLDRSVDLLAQLAANDVDPAEATAVAVDGWARQQDGSSFAGLVDEQGRRHLLDVAGYRDAPGPPGPPPSIERTGLGLPGLPGRYRSTSHALGHACASYCTSPYAAAGEPALVLVWDGGMGAEAYAFRPGPTPVEPLGRVLPVTGGLYPIFASQLSPFTVDRGFANPDRRYGMEALLPLSGKAMAYAALGTVDEKAVDVLAAVTADSGPVLSHLDCYRWCRRALEALAPLGLTEAELLASFQEHLYRVLSAGLTDLLARRRDVAGWPLCVSGGCALNIKWNAALRGSGLFAGVWVPPFPNDAGSAIGAACAEMVRGSGRWALQWSVFAGPGLGSVAVPAGWVGRECAVGELAAVLASGVAVVVLAGRAELGPRALGHRSVLAAATDGRMRDWLNRVKRREWYRPVAPVCLLERAGEVFDPGCPDPFMLFDHTVRPDWAERIPAVVHVDGSARLQTVGPDNPVLYELLTAYQALTGLPVLCNTSANLPGRGFFPDPGSAMRWAGTRHVWADGTLYTAT